MEGVLRLFFPYAFMAWGTLRALHMLIIAYWRDQLTVACFFCVVLILWLHSPKDWYVDIVLSPPNRILQHLARRTMFSCFSRLSEFFLFVSHWIILKSCDGPHEEVERSEALDLCTSFSFWQAVHALLSYLCRNVLPYSEPQAMTSAFHVTGHFSLYSLRPSMCSLHESCLHSVNNGVSQCTETRMRVELIQRYNSVRTGAACSTLCAVVVPDTVAFIVTWTCRRCSWRYAS